MINLEEIDRQLDEIKGTFSEFEALRMDNVDDLFFTLNSCMRPRYMWRASDISTMLGYEDKFKLNDFIVKSFKSIYMQKIAINEYCVSMPIEERIDYLLTRYGCYLIMLHADKSETNAQGLFEYLKKLNRVSSHATDRNLNLRNKGMAKSDLKNVMDFAKRATFNQF